MRNVFAFLLALTLCPAAQAESALPGVSAGLSIPEAEPEPQATKSVEERLDTLFSQLKREPNEKAAQRIAGKIWQAWFESGSASIDLMMKWANDAIEAKNYPVALDFLDQIVVLEPKFAEGFNRRATVHFMMRDFGKSMADIERTLQLEPRHFGALTGLAEIMKGRNSKQLSLDAYQRVLALYPMLRSAQKEVSDMSEDLTGERI
ncbi:hypothetical protein GA830_03070 [Mesorhizobium sp. NBSH29]|uniref:hypothetical protein n=1 Tax=Mesorhizobium sp. NBSH29 TaxID=2654249 RepID=UPI0018967D98|nr:hypothetical protein [Mesorhizobium sp. NBSH29]QPC85825.1 hypothetical protein GA830_03070 [Mesorhizobium sp. NBSH29]